jgi:hypothetical protein
MEDGVVGSDYLSVQSVHLVGMEKVLKLEMVVAAQLCTCSKCPV